MMNFFKWSRKVEKLDESTTHRAFGQAPTSLAQSVHCQVVLIGSGKMGTALIECWLGWGLHPSNLIVVEPFPSDALIELTISNKITLVDSVTKVPPSSVLFIAVKPQIADEFLPHLLPLVGSDTLIVSIMAGKTINRILQRIRWNRLAIVRAMPNLPATVGRGITVAVKNEFVQAEQEQVASALLAATGSVVWIDDEALLDAVTAVSGSGPAYVFLLAESLARAGHAAGLPIDLAQGLARATVAGSGELLYRSKLDAKTLRENVTSPGGTTAAALDVLTKDDGLDPLMEKAVVAATSRSRELAD